MRDICYRSSNKFKWRAAEWSIENEHDMISIEFAHLLSDRVLLASKS